MNLMNNINRTFSVLELKLKKHSPEILLLAGVAGVVTSAVMACKATTKVSEVIDGAKEQVDQVHQVVNNPTILEETYSVEDSKKDLAIIYTQTAIKLIKLYGPAVILGVASITSILASNNIMRKRNVALAAAYASVDTGFKEYRNRLVERFGTDLDKELKYNIKSKEVSTVVKDEKTGEEKVVTENVQVVDGDSTCSPYARFFDESCAGWSKDPETNLMFLRRQQDYANELLQRRGYLFLNDVYDMLGIQKTKAGQMVGWYYDESSSKHDSFIDFGIYNTNRERARAFVNGYEKVILLDFNVDGDILDMI